MVSKKYYIQVLIRIIFIAATSYGCAYVWLLTNYWFTFVNLCAFVILQIVLLYRYLTRWQKDLYVFARSVQQGDFTISYNLLDPGDDHYEIYRTLNDVSSYVRNIKAQYIQQTQYFRHVVENVQVGLMAYDEDRNVLLSNREALSLIGTQDVKKIEDLKSFDRTLYDQLQQLTLNHAMVIVPGRNRLARISARLSRIVIEGKPINVLSLLNIRQELDANELRSWQELISVLTHEIMNSITPINSLSGSMAKYLDKISGNEELVSKAQGSLQVINRRSQSLMSFVERYRAVSTVPLPHIQEVDVHDLIQSVIALLEQTLEGVTITLVDTRQRIHCDPVQMEQVFINVIRNAVYAMEGMPEKTITISCGKTSLGTTVAITDSGKGIGHELMEKIFIPFFTTRPEGSGIGLTLSRQIMQRHGGTIDVSSSARSGTTFALFFPNV
jgi:two-component system, NtrC family, nitrogen regulation sensor histidine kinase NtrY